MPLDEQSRRLTQFVIGNQQYEFNRFFFGVFSGPAAFSAIMKKKFPTTHSKQNFFNLFRRCFHAIFNKKRNVASIGQISPYNT